MRTTLIWATIFGATGILLGALGAHALKSMLDVNQLQSFETGVRYQMYHALFLLLLALLQKSALIKSATPIRNITIVGVFAFSGSIYLLNLQHVIGVDLSFLGPITPLGGLALISAWLLVFMQALRFKA